MGSVRLDQEEIEAMAGLTDHAFRLYVTLRRFMDYETGVVGGPRRRISWQGLAEELYVEPGPGKKGAGTPTKSRIRRAAATLEKAGLLENISDGQYLVFRALKATTDSSAQEKPDIDPTYFRHPHPDTESDTESGTAEPAQRRDSQGQPDREPDRDSGIDPTPPEPREPDTPPVSGIRAPTAEESETLSLTSPGANGEKVNGHDPDPVRDVFEHWRARMGKTARAKLTSDRRRKIAARLKEGYTVTDLKLAVDGCAASAWHMGDNDRGGKRFDDIELICRNGSKTEQFMDQAKRAQHGTGDAGRIREKARRAAEERRRRREGAIG